MAQFDVYVNPSESAAHGIPFVVVVNGQGLRALAHYSAPLPTRSLRQQVGNLAHQASVLIEAMDVVVSGF